MSCQSLEDVAQLEVQEEEEEEEEDDSGRSKGQGEERKQEAEDDGKDSEGENPLEKYMKMVLETRGKQQEKVPCTLGRPERFLLGLSDAPHPHLPLVVFSASQQRRETLEPGGQNSVRGERQQVTEVCQLAGGDLTLIVKAARQVL